KTPVSCQPAQQQALRFEHDAGLGAGAIVEPHSVADLRPQRGLSLLGHTCRGQAGRNTAWLGDDYLPRAPGRTQQGGGHLGGLAGSWRRDQDQVAAGGQDLFDLGENLQDRQLVCDGRAQWASFQLAAVPTETVSGTLSV